jgi:RNA polymerase sigma-70 factor (ECF subfamily)
MDQFSETKFEELFRHNFTPMVKTAYFCLNDLEWAEDVTQEVFSGLWTSKNDLSSVENPKAYLQKSVRNRALDEKQQKVRRGERENTALQWNDGSDTPEEQEELLQTIRDVVNELPPKCRLIFSLSRFEGLSNDEIAKELELSKRTVETQISNALWR